MKKGEVYQNLGVKKPTYFIYETSHKRGGESRYGRGYELAYANGTWHLDKAEYYDSTLESKYMKRVGHIKLDYVIKDALLKELLPMIEKGE